MTAVSLRKAGWRDCRKLWLWRNDPLVRRNSFSSKPVPLAAHKDWLRKKLADPSCGIWIGKYGARECGMVRLNFTPRKTGEIHISITRSMRGRGVGVALLRAGCLAAKRSKVRKLKAHVLAVNLPSKRIFEKNGFKVVRKKKIGGQTAFLLMLRLTQKK